MRVPVSKKVHESRDRTGPGFSGYHTPRNLQKHFHSVAEEDGSSPAPVSIFAQTSKNAGDYSCALRRRGQGPPWAIKCPYILDQMLAAVARQRSFSSEAGEIALLNDPFARRHAFADLTM